MEKDLRKRLEEAAEKDWETNFFRGVKNLSEEDMQMCARSTFILGGKWMFKECGGMTVLHDMRRLIIAQCKEWLKEHSHITEEMRGNVHCSTIMTMNGMLTDFEADMNKLWE